MISKNKIKFLKSLNLLKFRFKYNMFKVEGWKSLKEFLDSDYKLVSLFATSNWLVKNDLLLDNIEQIKQKDLVSVSSLKTPSQIIGVFEKKSFELDVNSLENQVSVFLEDVSNPGNLGSVIRTCDWFGINQIICSNQSVDMYNPKVVQSSMGSLSRVSIKYVDVDDFFSILKQKNIFTLVADLNGQNVFNQNKLSHGIICFGNESRGVSGKLKKIASQKITIPKKTKTSESLNLSVSFGIIISQLLTSK